MKQAYIKHPIDKDTKKRINTMGYCVIDARFSPKDYTLPDEIQSLFRQPETVETVTKRKGRPPKKKD